MTRPRDLRRALGPVTAFLIGLGVAIGSGIFRTPSLAAASLGSGKGAKNEGGDTTRATGARPSARRFVGDPAARAGLDGRKDTYTGNASRKPSRGGGGRGKR